MGTAAPGYGYTALRHTGMHAVRMTASSTKQRAASANPPPTVAYKGRGTSGPA